MNQKSSKLPSKRRNHKDKLGKILEMISFDATSTPNFTQQYKYLEQKLEFI